MLLEKNARLEVTLGNLKKELEELSKRCVKLDGRLQEEAEEQSLMQQEIKDKDQEMDVMRDLIDKSKYWEIKLNLQAQEMEQTASQDEKRSFLLDERTQRLSSAWPRLKMRLRLDGELSISVHPSPCLNKPSVVLVWIQINRVLTVTQIIRLSLPSASIPVPF
uniref:Uncharacterized protein n=1 Tax=Knipowitschia caucasica TaxID=637954 RepID=A0AAV2MDN7_KNICA